MYASHPDRSLIPNPVSNSSKAVEYTRTQNLIVAKLLSTSGYFFLIVAKLLSNPKSNSSKAVEYTRTQNLIVAKLLSASGYFF